MTTTTSAPLRCGRRSCGHWEPSARTPTSRPKRPGASPTPPPPCTPTPSRPSWTSWPPQGGETEYQAFLARYRAPANPQEENRYLYALTSFRSEELAERTFDLALSEVRTQNAPFVLQLLVANRTTGPAAWTRVTKEWDTLVATFPSNILPRMLDGVRGLCTPSALAGQVTDFVETHPLAAGGRTVDQILERLAINVAFGQREASGLAGGPHRGPGAAAGALASPGRCGT